MKYMGGKTALLGGELGTILLSEAASANRFVDLFAGSGAVVLSVAAAVLMRGGWPALYHEGGALLDPMCGSGTLLIEGALMAADVAPGLQRHGNALPTRWSGFDAAAWRTLFADAVQREADGRKALRPAFFGSDIDLGAIRFDASHGRHTMEYYDGFTFSFTAPGRADWPPVASGGRYDALTAVLGQGSGNGTIPAVGGIIRPALVAALC